MVAAVDQGVGLTAGQRGVAVGPAAGQFAARIGRLLHLLLSLPDLLSNLLATKKTAQTL